MRSAMKDWVPKPPKPSTLDDHAVIFASAHLQGKTVALLVTGGIAAYKTPMLARELRRHGATVVCYLSEEARKYVAVDSLEWATNQKVVTELTPAAEHLAKDQNFDIFLVAPCTYNTINKFRYGIADSLITTTLAAALGRMQKSLCRILICPTMNGDMHNSVLQESLLYLQSKGVFLIAPRDEYGKHNLPSCETVVATVIWLIAKSKISRKTILLTGGPTPTRVDSVRRLTNKFTGALAIEIAKELHYRGADVHLILGRGSKVPPEFIASTQVEDYDEYKQLVLESSLKLKPDVGIFSAAVADYKPKHYVEGKIPSGELKSIELEPTEKVIDLVRECAPKMRMISFKYQENMTHEDLMQIGRNRLERGHAAVVVNRGEERTTSGEQVAYLLSHLHELKLETKKGIASGIASFLESQF